MASDTPRRVESGEPLLRRLLRRRAEEPVESPAATVDAGDGPVLSTSVDASTHALPATQDEAGAKIDARTGKPVDELTDADLPPLESLGPGSDFSGFLGRNISPALRQRALRQLFHQPQFNTICLCAEYAENYNNFTALGDIVPHDLTRQLGIQAERMAKKLLAAEHAEHAETDAAAAAADTRNTSRDDLVHCDTNADATKVVRDSPTASDVSEKSSNTKP